MFFVVINVYKCNDHLTSKKGVLCFFFNQRFPVSGNNIAHFSIFSFLILINKKLVSFGPHAILTCSYSLSFYKRKLETAECCRY